MRHLIWLGIGCVVLWVIGGRVVVGEDVSSSVTRPLPPPTQRPTTPPPPIQLIMSMFWFQRQMPATKRTFALPERAHRRLRLRWIDPARRVYWRSSRGHLKRSPASRPSTRMSGSR